MCVCVGGGGGGWSPSKIAFLIFALFARYRSMAVCAFKNCLYYDLFYFIFKCYFYVPSTFLLCYNCTATARLVTRKACSVPQREARMSDKYIKPLSRISFSVLMFYSPILFWYQVLLLILFGHFSVYVPFSCPPPPHPTPTPHPHAPIPPSDTELEMDFLVWLLLSSLD